MVRRVFGRVDSRDVEFIQGPGGSYSVAVPFDTDGEYVAEIYAEDEAGNISYITKMLFQVRNGQLRISLPGNLYKTMVSGPAYSLIPLPGQYTVRVREDSDCEVMKNA